MDNKEFIEKLNQELEENRIKPPSRNDVQEAFGKYMLNKTDLEEYISMGILYYSYNVFINKIVGTCFEECLGTLIYTFQKATKVNMSEAVTAINNFYPFISAGYKSVTEINLINPDFDESRIDLFAHNYMKSIGDLIECALKPHVLFFDKLFSIINKRGIISRNLGDAITYLSRENDILNDCYKTMFNNVQISQWRNVANHNDYKILPNNEIEIEYGLKKRVRKIISRDDLKHIAKSLDTLLYTHKIAFTLISIDNKKSFNVDLSLKHHLTIHDDIISQLVETTYAFGYRLTDIQEDSRNRIIFAETKESSNLDKNYFENYIVLVARLIGSNFELRLYNSNKKIIYKALLSNRELNILHYNS